MNKNSIEIPLVKATYEELQEVICELQVERYKYKIVLDKIKAKVKDLYSYADNEEYVDNYCKEILELLEEIE